MGKSHKTKMNNTLKQKRFIKQVIRDKCSEGIFSEYGRGVQSDIKHNAEKIAEIIIDEDFNKDFEEAISNFIDEGIFLYLLEKNSEKNKNLIKTDSDKLENQNEI